MQLTGHRSRAVFDRYNIVREDELHQAGARLVAYVAAQASAAPAPDGLSPAACAALRDLYRQASDELRRTLDRLPVAIVNLELEGAVPRDGGADEPRGRRPGEAPDRHRLDGTGV